MFFRKKKEKCCDFYPYCKQFYQNRQEAKINKIIEIVNKFSNIGIISEKHFSIIFPKELDKLQDKIITSLLIDEEKYLIVKKNKD